MLFEKKMDPRCAYCQRCAPLDEESVMCIKRGVGPAGFHCRAFKYDPLKRVPPPPRRPGLFPAEGRGFCIVTEGEPCPF